MLEYLKAGVTLVTLDPNKLTNAVYLSCDEMGYHIVVSDFGNKMYCSTEELLERYKLPDWYIELLLLDYPFDTLEERWTKQIELLTQHLSELK